MYDRNPSNLRPRVSNVLKQNKTHMALAQQEIMQEWGLRQAEIKKALPNSCNYSLRYMSQSITAYRLDKLP